MPAAVSFTGFRDVRARPCLEAYPVRRRGRGHRREGASAMTIAIRSPAEAFVERLRETPCCAAIVEPTQLGDALASVAPIVFILRGNGLELAPVIERVHAAGKLVAAHLDLVDGLRPDRRGVAWLARAGADAIIT